MAISPVKIWRRQKEVRQLLGQSGVVISWTFINIPPLGFKKDAPYAVVLVEMDGGTRAFGQLVDGTAEGVKIGMRVRCVLRKVREVSGEDIIPYGLKFKTLK